MDYAQLGVTALKTILDYKRDDTLNKVQMERDMYKQKAEDLSSKLDNMKRRNSTAHHSKSHFNNGNAKTSRSATQSSSQGSMSAAGRGTTYSKSMCGQGTFNPVKGKNNPVHNRSGSNTSYSMIQVKVKVQNSNSNPSPGKVRLQNSQRGRGKGHGNSRPVP